MGSHTKKSAKPQTLAEQGWGVGVSELNQLSKPAKFS